MIVYANTLRTIPGTTLDQILYPIARWLGRKEGVTITAGALREEGHRRFRGGRVELLEAGTERPLLYSLRYSHRDAEVSGRDWITEIGVRHGDGAEGHSLITFVLRTDEISARVSADVMTTRPAIVEDMTRQDWIEPSTPGLSTLTLGDRYAAEALKETVYSRDREHALVVVSPTPEGEFLISPELIRAQVVGLADVISIPPEANTYEIADVLGKRLAAWRGAINVIFPSMIVRSEPVIPNVRFMATDFASGARIDTEILECIAHRSNRRIQAIHVSPGTVRDIKQRRELARRRRDAEESGDTAELLGLLAEEVEGLKKELASTEERLLEEEVGRLDDADQYRYELEALKLQLANARSFSPSGNQYSAAECREAVLSAISGEPTLEDTLLLLSTLFSDRVVILDSAWESAKESKSFRHRKKAFDLLLTLATGYYDEITQSGKGDAQARQVFGNAYSVESESVQSNPRARALRTFIYRGEDLLMCRHLKIGTKDSLAETLRVHFDLIDDKIVIGHCGRHLDFR